MRFQIDIYMVQGLKSNFCFLVVVHQFLWTNMAFYYTLPSPSTTLVRNKELLKMKNYQFCLISTFCEVEIG